MCDDCLKIFAWGGVSFSLFVSIFFSVQIFFYFAQSVFVCGCKDDKREREREKGGRRRAVLPYSECPPKAQNFDDKNNSGEHHHGERETTMLN